VNSIYEVVYSDVVGRMKDVGKLKNDTHLAKVLGITPQAISNYKKNKTISSSLIVKFAHLYGLSVDWLITGAGKMTKPSGGSELGDMSSIALISASPVINGSGQKGVQVSSISIISPEEMILAGKLVKILRSSNKTLSNALRLSIDALTETVVKLSDS